MITKADLSTVEKTTFLCSVVWALLFLWFINPWKLYCYEFPTKPIYRKNAWSAQLKRTELQSGRSSPLELLEKNKRNIRSTFNFRNLWRSLLSARTIFEIWVAWVTWIFYCGHFLICSFPCHLSMYIMADGSIKSIFRRHLGWSFSSNFSALKRRFITRLKPSLWLDHVSKWRRSCSTLRGWKWGGVYTTKLPVSFCLGKCWSIQTLTQHCWRFHW